MERSNIYKGLGSLDELGTSEIVENLSIYTQKLREKFRGLPEMEAIIYDEYLFTQWNSAERKGKWRPQLQDWIDSNDPEKVKQCCAAAQDMLPDFEAAMKELVKLDGVGPATASLVLTVMDDSLPFLSDELALVCMGKPKYTVKFYTALVKIARKKAQDLGVSVRDFERSVWTMQHAQPYVSKLVRRKIQKSVEQSFGTPENQDEGAAAAADKVQHAEELDRDPRKDGPGDETKDISLTGADAS